MLTIYESLRRGDHDLIPAECADHIAQAISGARLVILEDCGHFAYLERPEEISKEIAKFLSTPRDQNQYES